MKNVGGKSIIQFKNLRIEIISEFEIFVIASQMNVMPGVFVPLQANLKKISVWKSGNSICLR
jgi:hypothetical protein